MEDRPLPLPRTNESAADFWSRVRNSEEIDTANGRVLQPEKTPTTLQRDKTPTLAQDMTLASLQRNKPRVQRDPLTPYGKQNAPRFAGSVSNVRQPVNLQDSRQIELEVLQKEMRGQEEYDAESANTIRAQDKQIRLLLKVNRALAVAMAKK